MKQKDKDEIKVVMSGNKIISRKKLFEEKENYHKQQARLPFEEKIKILIELQKIASRVKRSNSIVWKV